MKLTKKSKKAFIFLTFILPKKIKLSLLSTAKNINGRPKFTQPCQLNGKGTINFGKNVVIGIDPSPFLYNGYGYIEARNVNSKISIGDDVIINNNIVLISEGEGITVLDKTIIGTQCEIYDSDFHNLDSDKRLNGEVPTKKVLIDKNVFIGSNVKILKGVTIGENSVIANGSIVTKSIPANVLAAGIPAKVIKKI
jgi:acetyltransferase-like isoleucine patch superfamily enzyme